MGCGTSSGKGDNVSTVFQPSLIPIRPNMEKPNALTMIRNYDLWLKIFDYFNIRDLARVSQVCRAFYKVSGDKKLFAKFDRPFAKKAYKPRPAQVPKAPANMVNIEHHNEVYIFANSVVLPNEGKVEYDIVTDQPGIYKAKNPIRLNTLLDPAGTYEKHTENENPVDTFRANPLQLSRPTPKFVTPAGGKRRFVFFCDPDGVTSQVVHQQSPHSNRILSKRESNTPSVTDHLENPSTGPINP